jgi:hypothetical protein
LGDCDVRKVERGAAQTTHSEVRFRPVCMIPLYFFCSTSPCMHVLIVSSGWVSVAENREEPKAPAASATSESKA